VFNLLLQIFDDGHLTDAKGRRVDFRNSIIIMTSNVGAELIRKGTTIGFASRSNEAKSREQTYKTMKENLLGELKKTFRPEFLNRVDGVVVFHSLTREQIRLIVDLMLTSVTEQLSEKDIKLEVTDAAKDFLGEKGYDEVFGARPLRRVIQDMIEDKLSDAVLRNEFERFPRVFEVEAEVAKITSAVINAIKKMSGVRNVKRSGDLLTVYCSEDLKSQIEKTITENNSVLVHIKAQSYTSKALVDVAGNEIVLKTAEKVVPDPEPVGALMGDDK